MISTPWYFFMQHEQLLFRGLISCGLSLVFCILQKVERTEQTWTLREIYSLEIGNESVTNCA